MVCIKAVEQYHQTKNPTYSTMNTNTCNMFTLTLHRENSPIEYMVPVCSDKVPCQRLTDGVTCNGNNGGGGILLTDLLWVQAILQIPATHSQ